MDAEDVKKYFENAGVVADYARAARMLGLWKSEKEVFSRFLKPSMSVLELGCGAGRVGLGLAREGFSKLTLADVSAPMADAARAVFSGLGIPARIDVADAAELPYPPGSFDACVFAFNGFMQIPGAERRLRAAKGIRRALADGGVFIFTTHDRLAEKNASYWERERLRWNLNSRDPRLDDFGDILYRGAHGGFVFVHSPTGAEVRSLLEEAGFETVFCKKRSLICPESAEVEEFSDDCVFWAAKNPGKRGHFSF